MSAGARPLPRHRAAAIAEAFRPDRRWGNRWHYYYAREKLASDPLYPGVLDALRGYDAPLLDVGCGLGLLAHALRADAQTGPYLGTDLDAGKIGRARRAAARAGLRDVAFDVGDLTRGLPPHAGSVAILDTLQYLSADAQRALLDASIAMLTPGARLVIRAALDDGERGGYTRLGDRLAHLAGWMASAPRHYARLDTLRAILDGHGLRTDFAPLHGRTPFHHWLVVARRE